MRSGRDGPPFACDLPGGGIARRPGAGWPWSRRASSWTFLGLGDDDIPAEAREAVLAAFPREDFTRRIIRAFADRDRAHARDGLERMLPGSIRPDFCAMIERSPFRE